MSYVTHTTIATTTNPVYYTAAAWLAKRKNEQWHERISGRRWLLDDIWMNEELAA